MAIDPLISYLRLRVVNISPLFYFADGFESTGPTSGVGSGPLGPTLWHSLGTEAGSDQSKTYWTDLAGSSTYSANTLSVPAAGKVKGGHPDWGDVTYWVRFKWVTGLTGELLGHVVDASNYVYAGANGTNVFVGKNVAGVDSGAIQTHAASLVNGTFYWLQLICSGTSYTGAIYSDSTGTISSQIAATAAATIADAAVQNGQVGAAAGGAAMLLGGAFANVCFVIGALPDGTQGQAWTPVVTLGEPAFAWSKNSPQAGTFSASIAINGSGNLSAAQGSWQQTIRLFSGSSVTLSAQVKSVGSANASVSAGGLGTASAPNGSSFGALSASGAMTANPTVSCALLSPNPATSGTAYFDTLAITNPAYEITNDLFHLHTSTWNVRAIQPGNPGNSAIGDFTIPLPPPGTEQYAANKAVYDQLDYYQRVEGYVSSDSSALGKLAFTGIITGITKVRGENPTFELTGQSDTILASRSAPFPGELLSKDVTSKILKSYLGKNEIAAYDTFNPFTAANYLSTKIPATTSGTWTGTTDDGFNVVTNSTGSGAVLLSLSGGMAGDRWHTHYLEFTGRVSPSADATRAAEWGCGISTSNSTINDAVWVFVVAKKYNGRYQIDAGVNTITGGAVGSAVTTTGALQNADDPDGFIPFTIGLLWTLGGNATATQNVTLIVNGKIVLGQIPAGPDPGTATRYPFLYTRTPNSGTANYYFTNLIQQVRVTTDGPSTAAVFGNGTITTTTDSLPYGVDPGPSFIETWTRLATRDNFYWRYTPLPYVVGTRTLGTVDFAASPGTDRTASVIFREREGTLITLALSANSDQFASATATSGQPSPDGGGVAHWRDIGSIVKYGVIHDEALAFTHGDFGSLRRASWRIVQNKIALGPGVGSKTATVLRDPQTADTFRELDKITIDDPLVGVNNLGPTVLAYTFTEGDGTQTLTLDQFSELDE